MLDFTQAEKLHKTMELVSTVYTNTKQRMMNEQRALMEVLGYIGDSCETSVLLAAVNALAHGGIPEEPQKELRHKDDEMHQWIYELKPEGVLGAILSRYDAATPDCISAAANLITRYLTISYKTIGEALSAQEDDKPAA